jgi:preprotein translocase subunit SecE
METNTIITIIIAITVIVSAIMFGVQLIAGWLAEKSTLDRRIREIE